MEIPKGYRELEDKEPIKVTDEAFGRRSDGTYGWGSIPQEVVGQLYRKEIGSAFVVRKLVNGQNH